MREVDGFGKLERICILKKVHCGGFGKVAEQEGISRVKLHGQTQAEGFYKKLGYQTTSDIFMEDGIPHILMQKDLIGKGEEA